MSSPAVAIVGGSGGIGSAIARHCARSGWLVGIGYRSQGEQAEALARQLSAEGGRATALAMPLDDEAKLQESFRRLADQGDLKALVLSASPSLRLLSFAKTDVGEIRRQLDVHVLGSFQAIKTAWRTAFRSRGGGHVVGILSAALGPPPAPHMAAYAAAKSGMASILESALVEFGKSGFALSTLSPDVADTRILTEIEPRARELLVAASRNQRYTDPERIAQLVAAELANPPLPGQGRHHGSESI